MKRWWLCSMRLLALCAAGMPVRAEGKLPKIFGDGQVLQQKSPVAIWGWAEKGEEVSVSLAGARAAGSAGQDGKWMVKLQTPAAGGPFELTVKGKNTITVKDVYVGEVWICSGQSNMDFRIAKTKERPWCGVKNEQEEEAVNHQED